MSANSTAAPAHRGTRRPARAASAPTRDRAAPTPSRDRGRRTDVGGAAGIDGCARSTAARLDARCVRGPTAASARRLGPSSARIVIDEQPLLAARGQTLGEIARRSRRCRRQGRARETGSCGEALGNQRCVSARGARRGVGRLAQRQPVGAELAHQPPRRSSTSAIRLAASSQVGSRSRTAARPRASRRAQTPRRRPATCESAARQRRPRRPAAPACPASSPTSSAIAPVAVLTTGRPRASASATAIP